VQKSGPTTSCKSRSFDLDPRDSIKQFEVASTLFWTTDRRSKHPNEWVFYEELGTSQKGSIMCVASGIAPELLFQASPDYWWDVEFIPDGHIKDSLVKVIARMTCTSEAEICGGMPNPTKPRSA
jgi:hypothetical protein